jgi:hypothetical protein
MNPTSSSQATLSGYGLELTQKQSTTDGGFENLRSNATGTGFADIAERLSTWDLTELDTDDYPDVNGYQYHLPEQKGPASVAELWRLKPKSYWDEDYGHENIPSTAGVFTSNADRYVQEHALDALDFADYYSRMTDLPYQFRYSADYRTHISPHFVKKLVRLANGKGRIDVEETELILCATGSVVAAGPRGVFWAEIPTVTLHGRDATPLPDPPEAVIHDVNRMQIPEEDPRLREAISTLFNLVENSPELPAMVDYIALDPSHRFRLSNGSEAVVDGNSLRLLNGAKTPSKVACAHSQSKRGEEFEVVVGEEDLHGSVGSHSTIEVDERECLKTVVQSIEERSGVIAGYRVNWKGERNSGGLHSNPITHLIPELQTMLVQPDLSVEVATQPLDEFEV